MTEIPEWIDALHRAIAENVATPEYGRGFPARLDRSALAVDDFCWIQLWPGWSISADMEFDLDCIRAVADTVTCFIATQAGLKFSGTYQGHDFVLELLYEQPVIRWS